MKQSNICLTSKVRIRFNKLKLQNGWTADFFLARLLDYWETTRMEKVESENVGYFVDGELKK